MTYRARIESKLTLALEPVVLDITDDSARHVGHAGHNPLGETHFSVLIVSTKFQGLSRVERHRQVYAILDKEMRERVHALSLQTFLPEEYN